MDNDVMTHRGYQGTVVVDLKSKVIHGRILHINDLVTYEADNVEGIEREFQEAVDDYLEFCAENDLEPNKPLSGVFQVRIGRELHMAVVKTAALEKKGLNEFVREALDCHINGRHQEINHYHPPVEGLFGAYRVSDKKKAPAVRVMMAEG
tara:strand:- start:821 stop:1270 length:450 start_codon:yes stop_codon:yes gene_type:complete